MSSNWNTIVEDQTQEGVTYTLRPNSNYQGADLRNQDFSGASISFSNFQNADLRGANFTLANMWNCDLRGADLRGCDFTKAEAQRCNFTGSTIESMTAWGAKFDDANFERVEFGPFNDFTRAKCLRTRFNESIMVGPDPQFPDPDNAPPISYVKLDRSDLSWAYLTKMDLTVLRLNWSIMNKTDFSDSDLSGRTMSDWDIEGARFERCNMQGVALDNIVVEFLTLDYADLRGASFTGSTIHSRIDMSGVNAEGVNFAGTYFNKESEMDGANFRFTNWTGANIRGTFARAADFSNSIFIDAGMREGRFQGANFENCSIVGCNLQGANFKTANFVGATVQNANDPVGINANDTFWNGTYLAGATFVDISICGAYTWEEAIFRDTITDENGNQRTLNFTGVNVQGPDCYLYTGHRELSNDVPFGNGYLEW